MNIPPILPVSTFPPLAFASGDGAAVMDMAGQMFTDVLSQSQEHPSADDRAEWQPGSDLFMPPPPDQPLADLASQNAVPSDDQPHLPGGADNPILPVVDGAIVENVSNIAEISLLNASSGTPPTAETSVVSEIPTVADAGLADMPADQGTVDPPSRTDLSGPAVEPPPPPSDLPPDPSTESGGAQVSEPNSDKNQPDDSPPIEDPSFQEFGPEIVSDMAEIEQSVTGTSGDPIPDAAPSSGTPSTLSSAPASASPTPPIHTQHGAALADHMIQVVQAGPDGPVILTLSPDDLGTLSFEVQQSTDGISVHLTVERPETLDLLRRHADQLLDAFRQAGFSGASFTFSGGEGGQRDRPPSQTATAWPDPIPPMAERFSVGLLDIRL